MMKKILVLCLLFINVFAFAQGEYESFESFKSEKKDVYDDTKAVFKLSFLVPAVGGEFRLAERFSLDLGSKLGVNAGLRGTNRSIEAYFFPQIAFYLEPKWNYNIRRRFEKGKKTAKFSSNFLSIRSIFNVKVSQDTFNYLVIGPTWGIQRNFKKFGYFKLNTGLGYVHVFDATLNGLPLTPIIDMQLGLMF